MVRICVMESVTQDDLIQWYKNWPGHKWCPLTSVLNRKDASVRDVEEALASLYIRYEDFKALYRKLINQPCVWAAVPSGWIDDGVTVVTPQLIDRFRLSPPVQEFLKTHIGSTLFTMEV